MGVLYSSKRCWESSSPRTSWWLWQCAGVSEHSPFVFSNCPERYVLVLSGPWSSRVFTTCAKCTRKSFNSVWWKVYPGIISAPGHHLYPVVTFGESCWSWDLLGNPDRSLVDLAHCLCFLRIPWKSLSCLGLILALPSFTVCTLLSSVNFCFYACDLIALSTTYLFFLNLL